ncbi:hypothetical protein D6C98_10686, partial [Aureobasidium pullulans]
KNHSTTREDSLAFSSQICVSQRRRGRRTKVACICCRRWKLKCDGFRPSCKRCISKATVCDYSVGLGETRQQAAIKQLKAYRHVLTLLRESNPEKCEDVLRLLREGETLEKAVGCLV